MVWHSWIVCIVHRRPTGKSCTLRIRLIVFRPTALTPFLTPCHSASLPFSPSPPFHPSLPLSLSLSLSPCVCVCVCVCVRVVVSSVIRLTFSWDVLRNDVITEWSVVIEPVPSQPMYTFDAVATALQTPPWLTDWATHCKKLGGCF